MPFSQLRKATQLAGREPSHPPTMGCSGLLAGMSPRWGPVFPHTPWVRFFSPSGPRCSVTAGSVPSQSLTDSLARLLLRLPLPSPAFRMGSFKELPRLGWHLLAAPSQTQTGQSSITCRSTEVTVVENQWPPLAPKPAGQFLSQLLSPVSCVSDSVTPSLTTFLVSLVFFPPPPSSLLYWLLLPTNQWMAPGSSPWLFPH